MLGKTGEINVQGEQVERLDKMATEAFVQELGSSGGSSADSRSEVRVPLNAISSDIRGPL